MTELTPADERRLIRDLQTHGAARAKARANARAESKVIAELAVKALDAGMSKARIASLAQISRPALNTMLEGA